MSKDLAVNNNGQNVLAGLEMFGDFRQKGAPIVGLEALDQTDMKLPKIKLIQQTSVECTKQKIPAGHFYNTITKEHVEKLECVLLVMGKSRVMWKKPFKRGEEPLCRSFDGKKKFDGTTNCANCQFAKWDNLKEGENKPACNMSYVWLGVDKNKSPFRLIMAGMNVGITKDFLNVIAPKGLPPFIYKLAISSEQKENESGVFYVAKYEIIGTAGSKEEAMELKDLSEGMRDLFMTAIQNDTLVNDGAEEEAAPSANGGLF